MIKNVFKVRVAGGFNVEADAIESTQTDLDVQVAEIADAAVKVWDDGDTAVRLYVDDGQNVLMTCTPVRDRNHRVNLVWAMPGGAYRCYCVLKFRAGEEKANHFARTA